MLGLSVGLLAQSNYFSVTAGGGISAPLEANRGTGLAGFVDVTYDLPLSEKTAVFVGAGLQFSALRDASAGAIPCDFPLGNKVVTFSELETFSTRRLDYTVQLGLERRYGKFALRGSLIPTYWLRDQIEYSRVISFDGNGRPDQVLTAKIAPGETIQESNREWTIDYSSRFHLQGGVAVHYHLSDRLEIGVAYRRGLTDHRLQNKTLAICGVAGCDEVDFENSRIDARTGSGFFVARFRL